MQQQITTTHRHLTTAFGQVFVQRWQANTPNPLAPIVLLHDSLGCVALWRDFPAQLALASGRDVIAYDRIGFGQSGSFTGRLPYSFIEDEANQVFLAIKQQLQLKEFIAFGHSVGGAMAASCAAAYPNQCLALVTESSMAFIEDQTRTGIRHAQQAFTDPRKMAILHKYHGDKAPWVLNSWTETWLADDFQSWDLQAVLSAVTCPVLAIHGDADEYGSIAQPQRYAFLPQSMGILHVVPKCGHIPHREYPDKVLQTVTHFLQQSLQADTDMAFAG